MTTSTKEHIPVLDGLRGISIGLVLFGHLLIYDEPAPWLYRLGMIAGPNGVSVFFVISGYLITTLLLREEDKHGSINLKKFYIRRALRIFPAFYVYLATVILLGLLGLIPRLPYDYVASILYLRNIFGRLHETNHIWSLSLEEQFYVFWPTLIAVLPPRLRMKALLAIMAAVFAWRTYNVLEGRVTWWQLYIRPDLRIDTILVGCALAMLSRSARFRRFNAEVLSQARVAWIVGPGLIAWLAWGPAIPYVGVAENTVTAILVALLMNRFLEHPDAPGGRFLRLPGLVLAGRLSYSLYLWQELFLGPSTSLASARTFPTNLALTIVCACLSYRFVERPFLAIKDRRFKT